jgi:serine/threonine protein kinase
MPPRRPSRSAVVDPQPGTTIGRRYVVERLIARGGVGVVYLARRADNGDEVVVKVLAASLVGDAEAVARFDREAERLSGVQHPNIVRMVDYGHEQGSAYLVMEYLKGELLSVYADRVGPMPLEVFAPIAAQVLKALNFAHRRGLMHRDIKPSNIMLCKRKGRANFVKILDFGMAKLVEGERDITSEQIVGTANYLSPEQIRGEPIDERVDVYALGVMFYMLLTGDLPFVADNNAALLYKHVHEAPPPLAERLPAGHDIPQGLVDLVHRCLAKDPAERPADAGALVEALVACVPAALFHLPVAEGATPTASSSYTVLPGDPAQEATDTFDRAGASTGRRRPLTASRNQRRTIQPRPVSAALPPVPAPPPSPDGGRLWLVGAGLVLVGLLVVGAVVLNLAGGRRSSDPAATQVDLRRVAARLDQAEAELLAGEYAAADRSVAAAEADLAQRPAGPAAAEFTRHQVRAAELRSRIAIASAISQAQGFERSGDLDAARAAYEGVLARDPGNLEARAAVERLRAPTPTPTPTPTVKPRPRTGKPEVKSVERPVDAPVEVPPTKDGGLLITDPKKKPDAPVFLPTK